jgi:hypothetical protein
MIILRIALGDGRVLAPYAGSHPAMDAMTKFNFSDEAHRNVHTFHTSEIATSRSSEYEEVDDSEEGKQIRTQKMIEDVPIFAQERLATMKTVEEREAYMARREARIKRQCEKVQSATVS